MNLNDLAAILSDSSLAIAGAIVAVVMILNLKGIINAIRDAVAEFNRGRKQEADALAAMQREYLEAGQDAVKQAIDIVTKMAESTRARMEEMEKELRELRLDNDRKDARSAEQATKIAEQATEITALKAQVKDLQRQLDEKTITGGDGSGKKKTRRAAGGPAARSTSL